MAYNDNGQLTTKSFGTPALYDCHHITPAQTKSIQYSYGTTSGTQNTGQITQAVDSISGETISYAYDSLKRLVTATSVATGTSTALWSQGFTYDGFGNLTGKARAGVANPIPGVDATSNRLTGMGYDSNGNMLSGPRWWEDLQWGSL